MQDFALARQHIVSDAEAQHGLQVQVDTDLVDETCLENEKSSQRLK
jgi:hypothetical protein